MGFYGNIANTSKTTFSFDLIYSSRWQMDQVVETDGVFLGRYVLIQYDTPPIKAYYNPDNGKMYSSYTYVSSTEITNAIEGQLYQDISKHNSAYTFYKYVGGQFQPITSSTESPYAHNFQTDVKAYGRGYDSTVWMKQFNPNSGGYKYVMMAELNAVVPTFHLVLDPPTEAPIAPYFDRDSTNIDYYLHVQPQYGVRVAKQDNEDLSDETVTRKIITWTKAPDSGRWDWQETNTPNVPADIYYNKAGFAHDVRTENLNVDNTINYTYKKSGRKYGLDPESSVWDQHEEKDDTYEWYFRLPAIGNSICQMWDKVYGLPYKDGLIDNGNTRNLNISQVAHDTPDHLVTYNRDTLIGMINTTRDILGYHFIPYEQAPGQNLVGNVQEVEYTPPTQNGKEWQKVSYPAIDCLYYKMNDQGSVTDYYHYAYKPNLIKFTGEKLDPNTTYYYEDGTVANSAMLDAKTADGTIPEGAVDKLFYAQSAWSLERLDHTFDDSIYSILVELHKIIGTNADEVRSFDSIRGSINIMKDLLGSINLNLAPGRLVHTNVDTGVIETTDTYFPGSAQDVTRVLDGTGAWVNRVKTITIGVGESESTNDISTVQNKAIEADNDNDNDITINSGNKWIRFNSDGEQHITVAHYTQTPQDTPERYNLNDNTNNVPTKESFDTQTVAWDEAGHIKSYVTTTYDLPKSYKYLMVTPITEDEQPVVTAEPIIADYTTDTLDFLPGNKWINLASQDGNIELGTRNQIIYSHKLSGVEEGSYGLASTETIDTLNADNTFEVPYYTVDKAGHVTASVTNTVTIPENFEKITLEVANDTDEEEMTAHSGSCVPASLTDTMTFGTKNKWIRAAMSDSNKRIDFAHRLSGVTAGNYGLSSSKAIDALDSNNTFEVPYYAVDKAGHITNSVTNTVTIPENFTTVTLETASDTDIDEMQANPDSFAPESLTDTITFGTKNKWIRGAVNKNNKRIDFAHKLSGVIAGNYGLATSETVTTLDVDNTFEVPYYAVDQAGHITASATNTVILPDNFEKVVLEIASDSTENDMTAQGGNFKPTTMVDTITFSTKNKWIKAAVDGKGINFAHRLSPVTPTASARDLQIEHTFTVPSYEFDPAGHLINKDVQTLSMPFAYKTFAVGEKIESNKNNVKHVHGNTSPNIYEDTFTFYNGNKWIDIAMNRAGDNSTVDDSITFSHNVIHDSTITKGATQNETPSFGNEFIVPSITIDEAGHVTALTDYKIKIPTDIGTLKLNGYVASTDAQPADIANTDTVNQAFAKLQKQINVEEVARDNAITNAIDNLIGGAHEKYNTLKEIQDILTKNPEGATLLVELSTELTNHKNANNPHNISKEMLGLDKVTNESKEDLLKSVDFISAVNTAVGSVLKNFTVTLETPKYNIRRPDGNEAAIIIEPEKQDGTISIIWYKKQLGSEQFVVAESVPAEAYEYEATSVETGGIYRCKLIREYLGYTSEIMTDTFELIYNEPEPAPDVG